MHVRRKKPTLLIRVSRFGLMGPIRLTRFIVSGFLAAVAQTGGALLSIAVMVFVVGTITNGVFAARTVTVTALVLIFAFLTPLAGKLGRLIVSDGEWKAQLEEERRAHDRELRSPKRPQLG